MAIFCIFAIWKLRTPSLFLSRFFYPPFYPYHVQFNLAQPRSTSTTSAPLQAPPPTSSPTLSQPPSTLQHSPFALRPSPFTLYPRTFNPVLDPPYLFNLLPFILLHLPLLDDLMSSAYEPKLGWSNGQVRKYWL